MAYSLAVIAYHGIFSSLILLLYFAALVGAFLIALSLGLKAAGLALAGWTLGMAGAAAVGTRG